MSELYNRIDRLCKERGKNVTIVCKEAGVARASLSELKAGRTKTLTLETGGKLALALGISVDELMGVETDLPSTGRSGEDVDYRAMYQQMVEELTAAVGEDGALHPTGHASEEIKIACPLTGREQAIYQPYFVVNGKRYPLPNNGCEDMNGSPECERCRERVMLLLRK